jgi:hypothetical protein
MQIVRNIAAHDGQTQEMFNKWMPQLLKNAIENVNYKIIPIYTGI